MKIAFISDLHLKHNDPKQTEIFIKFLKKHREEISKLYILGDLFEYWVNDDLHIPNHQLLIEALKNFNTPDKKTFIMHGNRDFLLGGEFMHLTNCVYISDPHIIKLRNVNTLLTHGDLFFKSNKLYPLYRTISRNKCSQNFFQLLPNSIKQKIALRLRNHKKPTGNYSFDHTLFINYSKKNNISQIISGHIHIPFIKVIKINDISIKHYSLDQLRLNLHVLMYEENKELYFMPQEEL